MRARLALGSMLLAASALACQVILGIEREEKSDVVTALDGGDAPPGACPAEPLPVRPAETNASSLPRFVMAMAQIAFAGEGEGVALDGVCSCTERAEAVDCRPALGAGAVPYERRCDAPDGGDNEGTRLFGFLGNVGSLVTRGVEERIGTGFRTLLVEVVDYSGEPNDATVEVSLRTSSGLFRLPEPTDGGPYYEAGAQDGGCASPNPKEQPRRGTLPDGGKVTPIKTFAPTWCGTDRWSYEPTSVQSFAGVGDVPVLRDRRAYVRDGVLVARIPVPVALPLGTGFERIEATDLRVVGRLEEVAPRPDGRRAFALVDAYLAGRLDAESLFGLVASMTSQNNCPGKVPDLAPDLLCSSLDVPSSPALDGKRARCDAVSFAFRVSAYPALLDEGDGGRFELPPWPCDDGTPRPTCTWDDAGP